MTVESAAGHAWPLRSVQRVDSDPAPSFGRAERAAEHRVTLADRRQCKRLARVGCAPLVARVRSGCAVLHEGPTVAASAAGPEFGVELLEGARTEPAQATERRVAKCRTDEAVDQQPVGGASGVLNLMTGEPLVEQVAERDVRPGRRGVLDPLAQPVAEHDRRVLGVGRTAVEQLPTGHGVVPAGDPDLVGASALADAREVLRSQLPARHVAECSHS